MKVKDLMTSDVSSCGLDTNLAAAAKIMWEGDCGAVPVTDDRGTVMGIITDRDICIAGATRSRSEGEIPVQEVMSKSVFTCRPGDDVGAALDTMRNRKVRRLPVVGHRRPARRHSLASRHRASRGLEQESGHRRRGGARNVGRD